MKVPTVLIIKTGSTYRSLRKVAGDFDDWIKKSVELPVNWKVKNISTIEPYKVVDYQGIIITGSHNSLCLPYPYLSGFSRVVESIMKHRIPTLGICFGHQLIHKVLGGEVIRNPLGIEIGISQIQLTLEGLVDPLFKNMSKVKIEIYSSHVDIVQKPCREAVKLAWNFFSEYQATRIDSYIYTVQFHPEYNKTIMETYIRQNWSFINSQHNRNPLNIASPEKLLNEVRDLRKAKNILNNFIQIVASS